MKTSTYLLLLLAIGCRPAVPGNGTVEGREQCDDGNALNGDGCNVSCELEVCGDGLINNGGLEQCDDGNQDNDDGCSSVCRRERCGDGLVNNLKEQCDDDNVDSGDGCNARCQFETCGDGIVNNKIETCDDKNRLDGDGCQRDCQLPLEPKNSWGFLPPAPLALDGSFVDVRLVLQDIDDDKKLDLVVLALKSVPRLYSGRGEGLFSKMPLRTPLSKEYRASQIVFADFNGDAQLDVFSAARGAFGMFFGHGLPALKNTMSMELSNRILAIAAGDVNKDGKDDAVIASEGSLFLFLGSKAGVNTTVELSTASFNALATADFNGDTYPDIAALNEEKLTLFLGNKDNTFKAQPPITVTYDAASLSIGDMNNDGISDLVLAGDQLETIAYQASTKEFVMHAGPELLAKKWEELPVGVCDFNNDGKLDVAVLESKLLRVFLGEGTGAFSEAAEFPTQTQSPFSSLATGDLNGDGECDIITSDSTPTVWLSDAHFIAKP